MKIPRICSVLLFAVMLALLATAPAVPALAATGSITLSPISGTVGSSVSISGTGFTAAANTYTVNIDGAPFFTGTTTAGGALTTTWFTVPVLTAGPHAFTVTTTVPDNSNTATFTVAPQITLSTTLVQVGDYITVSGTGFAASSNVIIYIDGSATTSTPTSTSGVFTISFAVPQGVGSHTVSAIDAAANSAAATYTIAPRVMLNQSSLAVGAQLTISGTSFAASSTVTIYIDNVSITSITSATGGSFTASFAVPPGVSGSHTIRANDSSYNTASTTYTIVPSIAISPISFTGGSQVTVSGTGFAGNSTIGFYIDGVVISSAGATTSTAGSFTASNLTIPVMSGGSHVFQAKDGSNNSATVNFSVASSITISPQSGTSGTSVQVSGNGFSAGRAITISFDGTAVVTSPSTPTTDNGGRFTATFTVPVSPGGSRMVVVTDGTLSATASFNVNVNASMSPVSGPVGTSVTVSGTSFASKGAIQVTYDGSPAATTTADTNGAFSATFEVPASSTGAHTVTVSDGTRNMSFSFSVVASLTISPASGYVGTPITLKGAGFIPSGSITIKYDDNQITTLSANATGGFAVVFYAPASRGGNHSIIVSDGTSSLVSTFAMDSTAPPVPTLKSPPNDTKADALTAFQWGEVTDPSGVTYLFQVSRNANFSDLVLEKKGLTNPGYQLTEQEKLESVSKGQPYYWRVKAVDGASNESTWTPAQSFYVGFVLATWALYTIFGAAVLIAAALGFWLGSRRRRL